jgi:hypothetical protein
MGVEEVENVIRLLSKVIWPLSPHRTDIGQ